MEVVVSLVIVAVVVGLGTAFQKPKRKFEPETILGGVAKTRNGRMESGRLVLDVDELRIDVEVLMFSDDNGQKPVGMRWRVEVPRPGTTTFRIYPEGVKSFANKLVGGHDVELDVHPAFDYTFMIKADDDVAVRRMWRLEQCAALMALSRYAEVHGKDQVIVLEAGFDPAPDYIERGIDLMTALGRADLYGVRVLRTLPDAQPLPDSLVKLPGPGEIRIGPYRDGDQVRTRIWSQIRVDRKVAVPAEVGNAQLASDGVETTLTWNGIEEDPRRLLAGVAFVRSFAEAPALGVFR